MSKGYVYILSNPSMPGLVKIGRTTRNVEARVQELYQTGVPTPFEIEFSVFSPDCISLERDMHDHYRECRVGPGREFFAIVALDASELLTELHQDQVRTVLDEYLPGSIPANEMLIFDEGYACNLGEAMDAGFYEIISALNDLKPEELMPALARYRARALRLRETTSKGEVLQ